MTKNQNDKRKISNELIRRGHFAHLFTPTQKHFFNMVDNSDDNTLFWLAARKSGKSYSAFLYGLKFIFQHRNYGKPIIVRHIFPTIKLAKEVMSALWTELKDIIPTELQPRYNRTEGKFTFPWGAEYILGGSLPENQDSSRGPFCALFIFDECAFWHKESFHTFINSVLKPQATHYQNIVRYIYITTPPKDIDHPAYNDVYTACIKKKTAHISTIYDNPFLNAATVEKIKEDVGGEESDAWQREYLCELVIDRSALVVPEFSEEDHVSETIPDRVDNFSRAVLCKPIIGGDAGLVDNTFFVFGYHDHIRDKYIVVDEWYGNYKTLAEIKEAYDAGLERNFTDWIEPDTVLDIFDIAGYDLRHEHGMNFGRPRKAKVEETISFVRDCFINDKVLIHSSCERLIWELGNAIWNERRTEISRSSKQSHGDGIMALAYALREVSWGTRPEDVSSGLEFGKIRRIR
jgi:phage terminase large subunit-like protein